MGFWDDVGDFFGAVGDAVASGAEAVGDAVETTVNAAAEVAGDVVETTGNLIQDGLNAIGGTGPLSGICGWLGGIASGVARLITANLIKGAWGLVGGLVGGLIKVIGGLITFHWDLALRGLVDILSSFVGGLFSVIASALSLIQSFIPYKSDERPLTKAERDALRNVFRGSLALYNIRIKNTSGLQIIFTLGNIIYCGSPGLNIPIQILVHECVHVWQYQNLGYRYLIDALGALTIYGRDPNHACAAGNAYDWIAELNRGTTRWEYFNKEAAAQLIEEIWTDGSLTTTPLGTTASTVDTSLGAFYKKPLDPEDLNFVLEEQFIAADNPPVVPGAFDPTITVTIHCARDGKDYTKLAIASVAKMRSAWNFRPSRLI
jgi:hypothetical protein